MFASPTPKHDPAFVVCKTFDKLYYEETDAETTKTGIDVFDAKLASFRCPEKQPVAGKPIRQIATAGEAEDAN